MAGIGGNGSTPNGASEATGLLALPVPPTKKEELPRCPYPGHENVSWTCRACGGVAHHLTSRFAMEPLQRVHGFKVWERGIRCYCGWGSPAEGGFCSNCSRVTSTASYLVLLLYPVHFIPCICGSYVLHTVLPLSSSSTCKYILSLLCAHQV